MILKKSEANKFGEWRSGLAEQGGVLLVDKTAGNSSFYSVAKVRRLFGIKKVGHAGTLDPFATGLLILCLGKATKRVDQFMARTKRYSGVVKLGATTASLDPETPETDARELPIISEEDIRVVANSFIGAQSQTPPMYSAKKVGGKKLYELARKNIEIERKPSEIEIYKLDIKRINLPFIEIDVECSKGAYIRVLARDFAERLGQPGYLSALRRTAIGEYQVEDAFTIDELIEINEKFECQ